MDVLGAMTVFRAVVEAQSFSGAARRLNLSNAAVSKQIAQLEDRLGVRLLHRTTRRLSLTDPGGVYYERCVQIIEDLVNAEESVSTLEAAPRGRLRINAPLTFGTNVLSPMLVAFANAYPEVQVDLTLNDRKVDLVEEGFDVAVRIANKLADSTYVARKLCVVPTVLCAAPAYLEAAGTPGEPADLVRHDGLIYTLTDAPQDWRFEKAGSVQSARPRGRHFANNGTALLEAAVAGFGIGRLPLFIAAKALADGRLVPLLTDWTIPPNTVFALYPQSRQLSPKVRAFVDHLSAALATPPWPYAP